MTPIRRANKNIQRSDALGRSFPLYRVNADIRQKQGKASEDIRKKESEEVKEYTRALEFRPTEDSALWGAVYAQIDLGNGEDAIDLARTITPLRPDSKAASAAYIVALELAIKTPGRVPEREKEVEARLKAASSIEPRRIATVGGLECSYDKQ